MRIPGLVVAAALLLAPVPGVTGEFNVRIGGTFGGKAGFAMRGSGGGLPLLRGNFRGLRGKFPALGGEFPTLRGTALLAPARGFDARRDHRRGRMHVFVYPNGLVGRWPVGFVPPTVGFPDSWQSGDYIDSVGREVADTAPLWPARRKRPDSELIHPFIWARDAPAAEAEAPAVVVTRGRTAGSTDVAEEAAAAP